MSDKVTILVICHHNSGRSQIAEAYLNKFYGDQVIVESAGLEPAAAVNPLVVKVLAAQATREYLQYQTFDPIALKRFTAFGKAPSPG